jgi:hypothetical protein
MSKYGGEGQISMNIIVTFDLDVGGYDLDDAYGEAQMWMTSTAEDIKLAVLESVVGDETVRDIEFKIGEAEVKSLDDSDWADSMYDQYKDEEMMRGYDGV